MILRFSRVNFSDVQPLTKPEHRRPSVRIVGLDRLRLCSCNLFGSGVKSKDLGMCENSSCAFSAFSMPAIRSISFSFRLKSMKGSGASAKGGLQWNDGR